MNEQSTETPLTEVALRQPLPMRIRVTKRRSLRLVSSVMNSNEMSRPSLHGLMNNRLEL